MHDELISRWIIYYFRNKKKKHKIKAYDDEINEKSKYNIFRVFFKKYTPLKLSDYTNGRCCKRKDRKKEIRVRGLLNFVIQIDTHKYDNNLI